MFVWQCVMMQVIKFCVLEVICKATMILNLDLLTNGNKYLPERRSCKSVGVEQWIIVGNWQSDIIFHIKKTNREMNYKRVKW